MKSNPRKIDFRRFHYREEELKMRGTVEVKLFDKDGKLLKEQTVSNLITNAGKAAIAAVALTDVAGNRFDWIAIGTNNTAPAAGDTALGAEISTGGGARAAATGTRVTTTVTNDTMQLQTTFTFTSSFTVQETGIFNASSAGDMLGRALIGPFSVVSGNTLQVTYKVAFA